MADRSKKPKKYNFQSKQEDQIEGGDADGKDDSEFDPKQLKIGIEHEMEHTDDKDKAKEIAKDHLIEDPEYYTHLKEMEKKSPTKKKKEDEDDSGEGEESDYEPKYYKGTGQDSSVHKNLRTKIHILEALSRHHGQSMQVSDSYKRLHRFAQIIVGRYRTAHTNECDKTCGLASEALGRLGVTGVEDAKSNITGINFKRLKTKDGRKLDTFGIEKGHSHKLEV